MPPMSIREYSRSRTADRNSVRNAIAKGLILVDDQGRIADPEQADAAWASVRRAPYLGVASRSPGQDSEIGQQSAKAKVAVALARLRLLKQRRDTMAERYVNRAEAIELAEREAQYTLDSLRAAPALYVDQLAAEMDITPHVARHILERFTTLALIEIGDLPRQAVRDAERA